jgi:hypothetical protein
MGLGLILNIKKVISKRKDYCPFFIILSCLALILSSVVNKHKKNATGIQHTHMLNVNKGYIVAITENSITVTITNTKKLFFFICLRFKGLLLKKVIIKEEHLSSSLV